MLFATAACNFSTSELQKVVQTCGVLYILTSKCAFRHSGVQFFDIGTSKSGPNMRCFVHFDFQMSFSPQRRVIFRHLNRQKWSEAVMFCTFWLSNVLFATAACNFSTSEQTKVLRSRHVLYILTFKCAFRHSGVQFLMSPLSTYLRTRRFNRPTFGLTRHTNLWKNTAFRDFSNIWRGCIFFLLTFWLLHLLSTDLTTLLLLFNSPYCRKFLFKLPSTMCSHTNQIATCPQVFLQLRSFPCLLGRSIGWDAQSGLVVTDCSWLSLPTQHAWLIQGQHREWTPI